MLLVGEIQPELDMVFHNFGVLLVGVLKIRTLPFGVCPEAKTTIAKARCKLAFEGGPVVTHIPTP